MAELDNRLKESLAAVAEALEKFEAVAAQCEFRTNMKHCAKNDYPNQENILTVLSVLPCLYAFCPRAHAE